MGEQSQPAVLRTVDTSKAFKNNLIHIETNVTHSGKNPGISLFGSHPIINTWLGVMPEFENGNVGAG